MIPAPPNPIRTAIASFFGGGALYAFLAIGAVFVVWAVSSLIGIGEDRQQAKQDDADEQVEQVVGETLIDTGEADDTFQQEKDDATTELHAVYTDADVRLAYQQGVNAALRERQGEALDAARVAGGCLSVPYRPGDGLHDSARTLQESFRGRGVSGDGAGPDQRDPVREAPRAYPLAGAGPAGD
ncbi:MAG: hypothetical protein WBF53_11545 [Litorimonas sp.]